MEGNAKRARKDEENKQERVGEENTKGNEGPERGEDVQSVQTLPMGNDLDLISPTDREADSAYSLPDESMFAEEEVEDDISVV